MRRGGGCAQRAWGSAPARAPARRSAAEPAHDEAAAAALVAAAERDGGREGSCAFRVPRKKKAVWPVSGRTNTAVSNGVSGTVSTGASAAAVGVAALTVSGARTRVYRGGPAGTLPQHCMAAAACARRRVRCERRQAPLEAHRCAPRGVCSHARETVDAACVGRIDAVLVPRRCATTGSTRWLRGRAGGMRAHSQAWHRSPQLQQLTCVRLCPDTRPSAAHRTCALVTTAAQAACVRSSTRPAEAATGRDA